jgi:transcriptional regulator with XRE-family HTH domain
MRLTERQTNDLIVRLEERKYGHRLNSMELAAKANVSLDDVNRVENQLPIADPTVVHRIANALGVTDDLLRAIAGYAEISAVDYERLERCLVESKGKGPVPPECEQLGLKRLVA